MSKALIITESDTHITVGADYLGIKTPKGSRVIGLRHIEAVYLNKAIHIDIGECYKIMTQVPLYIIDEHGYILARLREE